jgi:peptide/nickel transport system substrate-binding protein
MLTATAAFGPTSVTTANAASPVTFTVGYTVSVDSFNPFLGYQATSFEMWGLMYDSLVGYTMKDMQPAPALATSWDTSSDGLTWTFHLRSGVMWNDGVPLTSKDVAFTYNRIINGKGPIHSQWAAYLTYVTNVTAPDPTTVVLHLKKPNAVLPLLPIPVLPEHVWSKISDSQVKSYTNEPVKGVPPVGSGPFNLVSGTAGGSTYTFEANKNYWGGVPHVDQLVFKVFQNTDTAVQALKKGEIDFVDGITALQVKALQGQSGVTAINGQAPGFDEIAFNSGSVDTTTDKPIGNPNPAVLDPKFRYALGFAIDRNLLIQRAYQGAGLPGTTIVPPGFSEWHWEPPADQAFTFDLQKAGQLLDAAGYTMGSDGFRTLPDGKPIGTLRLFARSDSATSKNVLTYFSGWLKQLGIKSQVTTMNSNKLTNVILAGNFDIFEWGWYVDADPDSMLSYMTCAQRGNWSDSWYCNPQYDALYKAQKSELDHAKRVQIIDQMQQMLYQDAPYLVTVYNTDGEALRTDLFACMEPQPDPGGVLALQLGVHNYIAVRPAADAGNCDGVTTAIGAVATSATASPSAGSSTSPGTPAPTTATSGGGIPTWLYVGGVLVIVVVGGVVMMRRRANAGDRE